MSVVARGAEVTLTHIFGDDNNILYKILKKQLSLLYMEKMKLHILFNKLDSDSDEAKIWT